MPHEPGNRAMTRWGYSELLLGQPATDEVLQQGSLVGKYRCGMHASMVTKEQVPGIHIGLQLGHLRAIRHRLMDWMRRRLSCIGSGSTGWMPPSIARSRPADVCPPHPNGVGSAFEARTVASSHRSNSALSADA